VAKAYCGLYQILLLITLSTSQQVLRASDALSFFNNWFVTGDYAVAGVGLRGTGVGGWATGAINMAGVPSNAEPIAAFLYWSTVETSLPPSARVGYFDGHEIKAAVLGNPQNPNPPCWSSGGVSAPAGTTGLTYRADVLRYLPVDANNVRQVNGTHTVKLPDSGGGGNGKVLYTNGASLVVIYRIVVPGNPVAAPLRAVVIYDGAFTIDKQSAGMTQNVAGFYEASAKAAAEATNITANGQPGYSSPLSINGTTVDTSPFVGAQGARWDNFTYNFNLGAEASSFSTMLTPGNNQTCLTSVAIIASMNVTDTDGDGLLDVWEREGLHRNTQVSPATFGVCSDYPSDPCVNLPAMGANPNKKDIFAQIDWMHGTGDRTGGTDGAGTHDHMPQLVALSAVAGTFALHGINLHFDVGNNYQGSQSICGNAPCSFIIPAAYAQGGADIDESTLVCHDTATHTCDYHEPYPVLSFEFGFASVRDGNQLLHISPHFAQNRYWAFHYALFAHALGGPYDVNGHPIDPFTDMATTTPKSYSGIAHRPGGGFMVTFGLWRSDIPANDQVGSPQSQAGTLMHELGHNLDLAHAGLSTKPNCMPNYPSVMNYLYQTRGLTDPAGLEHVDYSPGLVSGLSEIAPGALTALSYRVRFYGPVGPSTPPAAAALLHCDGTPITGGAPEVRLESPTVGTPDLSNGSGVPPPYDLNFDGIVGENFADQPDWSSLNLQQVGSGYNFGGLSVGAFATDGGGYASDGSLSATDAGALATDGGVFATDGGAFATDGGAFATDGGVFATDGGAFATDGGAFATDAGELDQTTVILSSVDPPTAPIATNTISSILLSWMPPDTGNIQSYNIYRCAGAGCTPSAPAFKNAAGMNATPSFTDTVNDFVDSGAACPPASTCYNTTYTYSVTSLAVANSNLIESGYSVSATGIVEHLFIIANNKSRVYGSPNPPLDYIYRGLDITRLPASTITCTTTATQSSNVGTYPITCGPPPNTTLDPIDGITYTAGTLTITKASAIIAVNGYSFTYDANPHTATGTATGVGGVDLSADLNLGGTTHINAGTYNDPWTFTDPNYNSANGTVNDSIAQASATISVIPYSVIYDGQAHTATGTATGVGGANLNTDLNLTATTHTNVGTYNNDPWTFIDPNGNFKPVSGTVNNAIFWKFTLTPPKSPAKLGSSVPIQWALQDSNGNSITSLSTLLKLESVYNGLAPVGGCVPSLNGTYQTLYSLPIGAEGNSSFRYTSGFQFNWDTSTATSTGIGCYTVKISLNDGAVKITSPVQLK
jgi:hypothetical protein